jgi:hypothetical protein
MLRLGLDIFSPARKRSNSSPLYLPKSCHQHPRQGPRFSSSPASCQTGKGSAGDSPRSFDHDQAIGKSGDTSGLSHAPPPLPQPRLTCIEFQKGGARADGCNVPAPAVSLEEEVSPSNPPLRASAWVAAEHRVSPAPGARMRSLAMPCLDSCPDGRGVDRSCPPLFYQGHETGAYVLQKLGLHRSRPLCVA